MITIPVPAAFDATAYEIGEPFEVTATVVITDGGLELQAIDGMPVEYEEPEMEEDMELDEAGLEQALGRAPRDYGGGNVNTTTLTGTAEDAAALAVIGGTAFADTEVELLQQLLVAIANT